jgi:hypothetical protein
MVPFNSYYHVVNAAVAISPFSFLSLLKMSPSEAHELYESPTLRRCLLALEEERTQEMDNSFFM